MVDDFPMNETSLVAVGRVRVTRRWSVFADPGLTAVNPVSAIVEPMTPWEANTTVLALPVQVYVNGATVPVSFQDVGHLSITI
jgi:hypothetical protein